MIIRFISTHFEILMAICLSVAIFLILYYLVWKFTLFSFKLFLFRSMRVILLYTILIGEAFLLGALLQVYWINYHRQAEELVNAKTIVADTQWVNSNLELFFVFQDDVNVIKADGSDFDQVFTAQDKIINYHFSPNGQFLVITTNKDLYLFNLKDKKHELVDSVGELNPDANLKGSIGSVSWAPDSTQFCYQLSRWSQVASQDNIKIYNLKTKKHASLKTPLRKSSDLFWGKNMNSLYFLYHESMDSQEHAYAYNVEVYEIPLKTLKTELVANFPVDEDYEIPVDNLLLRNIEFFIPEDQLEFGRGVDLPIRTNEKGQVIGIDEDDHLYFVSSSWFKKRLFKVPREAVEEEFPRHQYKGGALTIRDMRWLPGGKYVIMDDKNLGLVILDPATNQIGTLFEASGAKFGWYSDPKQLEK